MSLAWICRTAARLVTLALVAAGAPLCAGAEPAGATPGVTGDGRVAILLMDAPVDRRGDLRAHRYIVDHLRPGVNIQRRVKVSNLSGRAQRVDVYAAAADIDKASFADAPGRTGNELTSWISVDRPVLDLPARGVAQVRVSIRVPRAAAAGERYAVIWAAVTADPDPGAQVLLVHRVGVRVYLDVGAGGEPSSDFVIGAVSAARTPEGQPFLTAEVRNTGRRALDVSGTLRLSNGPDAVSAGPYPIAAVATLAPGDSATVTAALPASLQAGPWLAELDLVSGFVKRSVTATVTFPPPGHRDTVKTHPVAGPYWGYGAGVLAAAAALGLAALALRRRPFPWPRRKR